MESLLFSHLKTLVRQIACLFMSLGFPVLLALAIDPLVSKAQDKPESNGNQVETDPDYAVPNGTPEEIMEFVNELKGRRPKFANRRESIDHSVRMYRAFIVAGDKILDQETSAKVAADAAQLKLNALTILAANNIGDAATEAMDAAKKLKGDERKAVSKVVDQFWTPIRIFNLPKLSDAERKGLTDEVLASVTDSHFSRETVGSASQIGDALANRGYTDEAGTLFERLAKVASESDDENIQSNAKRFEGLGRRARLPGQFMSLSGKSLNREEFDWASYRGKVVLVDFWATWCGPCIAELPNVKANYDKYHSKGFEVVGISLDRSREPLDKFIEKEEIPWAQLYDEEIQNGKGWNHPMAEYFGINAIPAAILVDKDGKVISMRARGPELPKLLEELLGKAE